jgi:hypothetical protein
VSSEITFGIGPRSARVARSDIPINGLREFMDVTVECRLRHGEATSDVFVALICWESRHGPLPGDAEALARIGKVDSNSWPEFERRLRPYFRRDPLGRWFSPTVELMRAHPGDRRRQSTLS